MKNENKHFAKASNLVLLSSLTYLISFAGELMFTPILLTAALAYFIRQQFKWARYIVLVLFLSSAKDILGDPMIAIFKLKLISAIATGWATVILFKTRKEVDPIPMEVEITNSVEDSNSLPHVQHTKHPKNHVWEYFIGLVTLCVLIALAYDLSKAPSLNNMDFDKLFVLVIGGSAFLFYVVTRIYQFIGGTKDNPVKQHRTTVRNAAIGGALGIVVLIGFIILISILIILMLGGVK